MMEKQILDNELIEVTGGYGTYQYHLVVAGDTLSGIALKYGTTVKQIMALNPRITNADLIYVGEMIRVR